MHFRDRFARLPDLLLQYLADFLRLREAEAAACKGLVTECEVRDALNQVSLNMSPGLDGLPYEMYLWRSHMFMPILMTVFNYWFAQGTIPSSITTRGITLLKKGCKRVWEELDYYSEVYRVPTYISFNENDLCHSSRAHLPGHHKKAMLTMLPPLFSFLIPLGWQLGKTSRYER